MKKIIILSLAMFCLEAYAQIGGRSVYDFLRITPSARISAMGGANVSIMDDDVHFAWQNPALANDSMHKHLALSFKNHLSDIGSGYLGYAKKLGEDYTFHTGIHYLNYGKFDGRDEFGNEIDAFQARDLAWVLGVSSDFGAFRYGVNLKLISSSLATTYGYQSFGVALDIGTAYKSKNELFMAGFAVRNVGTQLSSYNDASENEGLPLEVQIGLSNKLKYMPLRFSLTLTNLEHPNLIFEDPNRVPQYDLSGNLIKEKKPLLDNIVRHAVFGGEFLIGKAVRLRGGYNHMRRQELRAANRGGMSGFSLGFGLRISRFALDYSFSSYGVDKAFNSSQFGLLMNLNKK